jgi:hypothetical protein
MSVTNEYLKRAIDNISYHIDRNYHYSRNEEYCKINQNSKMAKTYIKMTGLSVKVCSLHGKLQPNETSQQIERILHKFEELSWAICDSNDHDFVLNEISDIGTYIIGITDTGLNSCTSN